MSSLSERVDEALRLFGPADRDRVAVVFTAHSLPRPVVERDPGYMIQIDETIAAVADRVGLARGRWTFAFQSAGHNRIAMPNADPHFIAALAEVVDREMAAVHV